MRNPQIARSALLLEVQLNAFTAPFTPSATTCARGSEVHLCRCSSCRQFPSVPFTCFKCCQWGGLESTQVGSAVRPVSCTSPVCTQEAHHSLSHLVCSRGCSETIKRSSWQPNFPSFPPLYQRSCSLGLGLFALEVTGKHTSCPKPAPRGWLEAGTAVRLPRCGYPALHEHTLLVAVLFGGRGSRKLGDPKTEHKIIVPIR